MRSEQDKMPGLLVREGGLSNIYFDFSEYKSVDGCTKKELSKYRGEHVTVLGELSYGRIVDAIVRDRYPVDKMESVILNKEVQCAKSPQYALEYSDMQAWRVKAKQVATDVLNLLQ